MQIAASPTATPVEMAEDFVMARSIVSAGVHMAEGFASIEGKPVTPALLVDAFSPVAETTKDFRDTGAEIAKIDAPGFSAAGQALAGVAQLIDAAAADTTTVTTAAAFLAPFEPHFVALETAATAVGVAVPPLDAV